MNNKRIKQYNFQEDPVTIVIMWWRFLVFCLLVTLTLFIVLSCIQGKPVIHLFFHRCCEENIENDQVIFENFGNNYLRERLVGAEIIEEVNGTSTEESVEMIESLNVHDPRFRNWTIKGNS